MSKLRSTKIYIKTKVLTTCCYSLVPYKQGVVVVVGGQNETQGWRFLVNLINGGSKKNGGEGEWVGISKNPLKSVINETFNIDGQT